MTSWQHIMQTYLTICIHLLQLPTILSQPNVAFHLLPLSGATQKASSTAKASNPKKRSRSLHRQPTLKGKGGPKGCRGKNRGPSIPAGLINKALETPQKQRLQYSDRSMPPPLRNDDRPNGLPLQKINRSESTKQMRFIASRVNSSFFAKNTRSCGRVRTQADLIYVANYLVSTFVFHH